MPVTGRDTENGRPALVIDAIPEQGSPVKIFFDSETGLILKQAGSRETPEGPITFERPTGWSCTPSKRAMTSVVPGFGVVNVPSRYKPPVTLPDAAIDRAR